MMKKLITSNLQEAFDFYQKEINPFFTVTQFPTDPVNLIYEGSGKNNPEIVLTRHIKAPEDNFSVELYSEDMVPIDLEIKTVISGNLCYSILILSKAIDINLNLLGNLANDIIVKLNEEDEKKPKVLSDNEKNITRYNKKEEYKYILTGDINTTSVDKGKYGLTIQDKIDFSSLCINFYPESGYIIIVSSPEEEFRKDLIGSLNLTNNYIIEFFK